MFWGPENLPLHHRVISWFRFMREDRNKTPMTVYFSAYVCVRSHHVSGADDDSAERRRRGKRVTSLTDFDVGTHFLSSQS